MGLKTPDQFVIGDVIKNSPGTAYSGARVIRVEGMGAQQTQVEFDNGQIVEFFNQYQHEMQE